MSLKEYVVLESRKVLEEVWGGVGKIIRLVLRVFIG